jgi:hypothetical protein
MAESQPARWYEMTPARWRLLGAAALALAVCGMWAAQCARRIDAAREAAEEIDEQERANRPQFRD